MSEGPDRPREEDSREPAPRESPSPWPTVLLVFVGGALAVASIELQSYVADFGACACLVMAWRLSEALAYGPTTV